MHDTFECYTLKPFGAEVHGVKFGQWNYLSTDELVNLLDQHGFIIFADGCVSTDVEGFAECTKPLGELQVWSYGTVNHLRPDPNAKNYLYTCDEVPLHWDGAFARQIPHYIVFQCLIPPEEGGETIFVNTLEVLRRIDQKRRALWRQTIIRYATERKVHYGGQFSCPVITPHPCKSGVETMRYGQKVTSLNPATVDVLGMDEEQQEAFVRDIDTFLMSSELRSEVKWRKGMVLIADNHTLLHGRNSFPKNVARHLMKISVNPIYVDYPN